MQFEEFKRLHQMQFQTMSEGQDVLFVTAVDKDVLWDTYLNGFPPGTNEIYRERREFDCSCCKQYIRAFGNVVTIRNNKLVSVWDFDPGDNKFGPVTSALATLVKSAPVQDVFVTKQAAFGTDKNYELVEGEQVRAWHHFRVDLPKRFVSISSATESAVAAVYRDTRNVFKRSLDEIARSAIVSILDLIAEKVLYRGEEWQAALAQLLALHDEYQALPVDQAEN